MPDHRRRRMDRADLPLAPRCRRSHMSGPTHGVLPGPRLVAGLARAARRSRRTGICLRGLSTQAPSHPALVALEWHTAEPLRLHARCPRGGGWACAGALGGPTRGPWAARSGGIASRGFPMAGSAATLRAALDGDAAGARGVREMARGERLARTTARVGAAGESTDHAGRAVTLLARGLQGVARRSLGHVVAACPGTDA